MKKIDLTKLYIHVEQAILLIPLLYIMTVSGSNYQITERNFITFTFEAGLSLMPRIVLLFVSFLYRLLRNEIVVYFVLAFLSLSVGIIASKTILHKNRKKSSHDLFIIVFLSCDLILRLLPLGRRLPVCLEIFSFIFRLLCLLGILMICREKMKTDH